MKVEAHVPSDQYSTFQNMTGNLGRPVSTVAEMFQGKDKEINMSETICNIVFHIYVI